MSTKIKVTNFRALQSAEIDASKISLIAADNEGGKTSFIQACRSVLTGKAMPIEGLTQRLASRLVHSGSAVAEIICTSDGGELKITFPDMTKSGSGKPLEISEFAAGSRSIIDTETKQRSNIVADMLKTSPTYDALVAELNEAKIIDPEILKTIWQTIQSNGWDAALACEKEKCAKNKGAWEETTGENYGNKKASEWMPKEWDTILATTDRATLEATVKIENEWLEVAISDQAVKAEELAALKISADKLPTALKTMAALEIDLGNLYSGRDAYQRTLARLPLPNQPDSTLCPHCKGLLSVVDGKITIPAVLTPGEIQKRQEDIEEISVLLRQCSANITNKNNALVSARSDKKTASDADTILKSLASNKKTSSGNTAKSVEDCRTRLSLAQARLAAFDKKTNATRLAGMIEANQRIIGILATDGLRLTVLKNKLTGINSTLKQLTDAAGWAPVEIKDDMQITYRGTPYMLISTAAQFKTRVVLQVASAKIDGSRLVLIDAADVLASNANRHGLIRFILAAGIPAIITMAFSEEKKVPRLNKLGGHSYWIENGIATKLK